VPSVPGQLDLMAAHQSSDAASPAAAAEALAPPEAPLLAALLAALDVADVELLVVELPLHADSTSATALMPAIVAVNFFVGL
jgi:hypothetical protein